MGACLHASCVPFILPSALAISYPPLFLSQETEGRSTGPAGAASSRHDSAGSAAALPAHPPAAAGRPAVESPASDGSTRGLTPSLSALFDAEGDNLELFVEQASLEGLPPLAHEVLQHGSSGGGGDSGPEQPVDPGQAPAGAPWPPPAYPDILSWLGLEEDGAAEPASGGPSGVGWAPGLQELGRQPSTGSQALQPPPGPQRCSSMPSSPALRGPPVRPTYAAGSMLCRPDSTASPHLQPLPGGLHHCSSTSSLPAPPALRGVLAPPFSTVLQRGLSMPSPQAPLPQRAILPAPPLPATGAAVAAAAPVQAWPGVALAAAAAAYALPGVQHADGIGGSFWAGTGTLRGTPVTAATALVAPPLQLLGIAGSSPTPRLAHPSVAPDSSKLAPPSAHSGGSKACSVVLPIIATEY